MIEVPPPDSFDGRVLRYGAMTCGQYVWFRAKWSFVMSAFTLGIGVWELTTPWPLNWIFSVIIFVSALLNVGIAWNWRRSWRFWNQHLELWLIHASIG